MRKILEDFYFGRIIPTESKMTPNSDLRRSVNQVAKCEQQLREQLDETGQAILAELTGAQQTIDSITGRDSFILGFRLGVRMMAECMDEDDGDTRKVVDHS